MSPIIDIALTLVAGLVILAFLIAGLAILLKLLATALRYWMHLTSRNTPPAAGQTWHSADREYHVIGVGEDGVRWQTGGTGVIIQSWEPKADWKARVRRNRLFLEPKAK